MSGRGQSISTTISGQPPVCVCIYFISDIAECVARMRCAPQFRILKPRCTYTRIHYIRDFLPSPSKKKHAHFSSRTIVTRTPNHLEPFAVHNTLLSETKLRGNRNRFVSMFKCRGPLDRMQYRDETRVTKRTGDISCCRFIRLHF